VVARPETERIMIEKIDVESGWTLNDYSVDSRLSQGVRSLRVEASMLVPALRERRVVMVNSTARGGGVAEMLPRMVTLLRELGIPADWYVIGASDSAFFGLTKRIHNLVHGEGKPELTEDDRKLYEKINRENADALEKVLEPTDILVVHDPQPLALGAMLKKKLGIPLLWRCHIGLAEHTDATRAAWYFLKPYAEAYDLAIFSAPEYIPDYLAGKATIIHPALDPFSHKNRVLSPHKLTGILCNAGLHAERHPVLTPPFDGRVKRMAPDGSFHEAVNHEEIGLLYRPIVTQVSRWDRLKGFAPLLDGFVMLKKRLDESGDSLSPRHRRRLEVIRLVLAGPDPESIQDDPEGKEVLAELAEKYEALPEPLQQDVALLSLPMESRKENALMVNALQRCSTIVVQNSLQEGFGLTATEAMWKRVPIVGTRAGGLRLQIRNGIDGLLIQDAREPAEVAKRLDDLLENVHKREKMARNAEQRVSEEYLIFTQTCHWLRALSSHVYPPGTPPKA
jgi:trehalose synthase